MPANRALAGRRRLYSTGRGKGSTPKGNLIRADSMLMVMMMMMMMKMISSRYYYYKASLSRARDGLRMFRLPFLENKDRT